jgi:hypothetical protein
VGLFEEIDKLELSDELKDKLRQEHQQEIGGKDDELLQLRRRNRKGDVETEITALNTLFNSEAPGLLKFVRRVYLSDDQQPGAVLMSDADLELSGDEATGSRSEEEISVADAIREVFKLMPRTQEGKLKLSDQGSITDDHGRPEDEQQESENERTERRKRNESTLGRPVERKRGRVKGRVS